MRPRTILLILGANGADAWLSELPSRGFDLVRARTPDAAEALLRELPVSLAIAGPEATESAVELLVVAISRTRRGVPVLAIRERDSGALAKLGVGVLRPPLLAGALARSVEVVLGLKKGA